VLRQRLLLGPFLILALLVGVWLDELLGGAVVPVGSRWLVLGRDTVPEGLIVFIFLLALNIMASREVATILIDNGIAASKRVTTLAAIAGLLLSCLIPRDLDGLTGAAILSTGSIVVFLGSLMFYSRHKSFEGIVAAAGGTLLAFVYLGLMLGFVLSIRRDHSAWVVLWVVLTTKSSDIGAFFAGITLGRHKMIPWLSPGKTWEGLAGGVLMAAAVGAGGAWVLRDTLGLVRPDILLGALAGALFAILGQAGDLIESLFKRDAGMKDSGRSVPGFGGVLDVMDSVLVVAPAAYWLLRLD
jgi:phosphatidate cytidylyltransferase